MLAVEHQNVVVEVGAMQAREVIIGEGLGEVEAPHLGAQRSVEGIDGEDLTGGANSLRTADMDASG